MTAARMVFCMYKSLYNALFNTVTFVIPFHCLVLTDCDHLDLFPQHERLSRQIITHDLVGDGRRDLHAIVLAELRHRIGLKLSLGQRVAVLVDDLSLDEQHQLRNLASEQGATVIAANTAMQPVPALPVDVYAYLRTTWKGITVVGDLHGDLQSLTTALAWARGRQHFVWFLGDVIDYGPETLQTADAVYHAVMAGTAALIIGNHERKIARWLDQRGSGRPHFRINDGNQVTIDALTGLGALPRRQWVGRFRSLLAHASLIQQISNISLLHAAAHPTLWGNTPNYHLIEQFALYGEADHSSGKFRRVHRWIDAVPAGQMVFVGHDVIGKFPIVVTGALGGRVVFLDTGCGTGGQLSTADLRFDESGLHLECFNRY
jgi:hypothetical protein